MQGEHQAMLPTEPDQPDIRVSDAERNEVVDLLREHCSEGRLTLEEFSDRVGDVFNARTRRELETVVNDLPVPVDWQQPAPAPAPARTTTTTTRRRAVRRWIVGIWSGGKAKGRWRPAEETHVIAIMGGCEVDLRNAEIDGPEVVIRAVAIMGGIEIIVPEGIEVELSGFALMGGNERKVKNVPRLPGTPVIHVQAFSLMGGVVVKSKAVGETSRQRPSQRIHERHQARHERHDRTLERALELAAESLNKVLPPSPGAIPPPSPAKAPDPPVLDNVPGGTVTILFSDIEGFSTMNERLGDRKAQEIVRVHNAIVRGNVGACGGFEVKTAGDGFMIAFDSASRALRCAQAVQHELAAYNRAHPDEPINVRMGLHTGEAIRDNQDFLGRTVIVASRIADTAAGGEILVSSLLRELVNGTGEFRFGDPREVELKGLSGTHQVVPVTWTA
jgi:class 3 adenylate cyclase